MCSLDSFPGRSHLSGTQLGLRPTLQASPHTTSVPIPGGVRAALFSSRRASGEREKSTAGSKARGLGKEDGWREEGLWESLQPKGEAVRVEGDSGCGMGMQKDAGDSCEAEMHALFPEYFLHTC